MAEYDKLDGDAVRKLIAAKTAGWHLDGHGLYLVITPTGSASWVYRYRHSGRRREMGLGSASKVKIGQARKRVAECGALLQRGLDPIESKREQQKAHVAATALANHPTFEAYAAGVLKTMARSASDRTMKQWTQSLDDHVYPKIGAKRLDEIGFADVIGVIGDLWFDKHITAKRCRQRIEFILDAATVDGLRSGENPAREKLVRIKLPKSSDVHRVKHQPSLPYEELPAFMAKLVKCDGDAARGLELAILTVMRTDAIRGGALRDAFDFEKKIWTVPAPNVKGKKATVAPFKVTLSDRAIRLVKAQPKDRKFVFHIPPMKAKHVGKNAFSENAMLEVLYRAGLKGKASTHGMRATFKTWALETTDHKREVIEMAMAHTIRDEVEAAYQRGELLALRFQLLNDWAKFCYSKVK